MTEKIIGIDLGTTNSEVAVVENGRVTVIDASPGNPILPSFVSLADDGSILVGNRPRISMSSTRNAPSSPSSGGWAAPTGCEWATATTLPRKSPPSSCDG
ncbi:MAG: Hsp70 family protein [Candidatus Competibacter sp.]|nr:Hsp70 family protein [Candidatus Competibacter sp.]